MAAHPSSDALGVSFPEVDGKRSTIAAGRAIVTDALREVDPVGADAAAAETAWRQGYVPHFKRLIQAGSRSPEAAQRIAADGLASMASRLTVRTQFDEKPLAQAAAPTNSFDTTVIAGTGAAETELSVPYRGERLTGDQLRRQVDDWVSRGIAEPQLADVIDQVMANPEWLSLPGMRPVILGAAAEMGPLRSLLRWGANVAAVDLPRPQLWQNLRDDTHKLAGTMTVPCRQESGGNDPVLGADLLTEWNGVAAWAEAFDQPLTVGNYVYADSGMNVRLSAAVDALTDRLCTNRPDTALSFLATPTDVFTVPPEAVRASVAAYEAHKKQRFIRVPLRTLSGGRLLRRNYVPGLVPGTSDNVIVQQGPNYLLAKRIQRWRATSAAASGTKVSFAVAPPTKTRSVLKNRALAAAYAGAHRFGIEVFEPATANTLMAAVMVQQLMADQPNHDAPWQAEAHTAVHGGLWRCAYDPRSALGLAALLGFASQR